MSGKQFVLIKVDDVGSFTFGEFLSERPNEWNNPKEDQLELWINDGNFLSIGLHVATTNHIGFEIDKVYDFKEVEFFLGERKVNKEVLASFVLSDRRFSKLFLFHPELFCGELLFEKLIED